MAGASKSRVVFVCNDCGSDHSKWSGRCADCGAWNSLQEMKIEAAPPSGGKAAGKAARGGGYAGEQRSSRLADVSAEQVARISSGVTEFDRAIGGGVVSGAVMLIGGDPGIGKSTLILQVIAKLPGQNLYVSGEESLSQISMRASRLGLEVPDLQLLAATSIEQILAEAERLKPQAMVVDSIQTLYSEALSAAPGAVSQLREATAQLVRFAKRTGTVVFVIGHVTKEGAIAGPRVLEHMVDTVLYFEADIGSRYRVLRSVKNRFGAANELGVFAMMEAGLKEVKNPSAIFLSSHDEPVAGSVVTVSHEGSRPMLAEVQALVDESVSHARRVALGLDAQRLAVLLGVLHRHAGIALAGQDVYVNVVGGLRISEPATDLAVLLAALSSYRDRPAPQRLVVFGEVGLAGEVRPVPFGEERLREAAKQGFTEAIIPATNLPRKASDLDLSIHPVKRLAEAVELY